MRTVLAKVRLTTGNVGWYDPLTNIHLTMQKPEAYVFEGMNVKNLKQGVMYKTITVIDGSLNGPSKTVVPTKVADPIPEPVKQEIKVEEKPEVKEAIVETVAEGECIEPGVSPEDAAPLEKVEKPKKKTTRKKKTEE